MKFKIILPLIFGGIVPIVYLSMVLSGLSPFDSRVVEIANKSLFHFHAIYILPIESFFLVFFSILRLVEYRKTNEIRTWFFFSIRKGKSAKIHAILYGLIVFAHYGGLIALYILTKLNPI